jgi:hypothetical protein
MTKTHKIICVLFFLFLILSCLQSEAFTISIAGIKLKYYHIFSLLFLPILFGGCGCSLNLPPKIMCFYFLLVFLISALMIPTYGLGNPLIAYMWGAFMIMTIYSIGKYIEFDAIISIFQKVAIIFFAMVWVNIFLNREAFIIFFINPNVHPDIPTFSQGGVNLEATWIALFGFFFKSKKGYIYLIISLFLSALFTSRVGMILNFLLFCWLTYHIYLKHGILNLKRIFQISSIMFLLGTFFLFSPLASPVLDRIAESGNIEEAGSRGRIAMWINFPEAFINNPMGYGAGNTMMAIETVAGMSFVEPNIHNTYMQNALDFGILGLFTYIVIILSFLLKEKRTMFASPFAGALLGYILASLIQFGGSENLLFILIGFYFAERVNIKNAENYDFNNNTNL